MKKQAKCRIEIPKYSKGYYVWGKYTSVAWFLNKTDAEACAKRMNQTGGQHYTVKECK